MQSDYRDTLKNCKKIVIKIGTSSLTAHENAKIDVRFMDTLAKDISHALNQNSERRFVIVTSGSVAAGMEINNISERPTSINKLQALSSLGQNALMRHYSRAFADYMYKVSQLLLTKDVVSNRDIFINSKRTLDELLVSYNDVIPVINENDATSIEGIKFGDNDTLASHVANLIDADLLIIISDVDGIYTSDPNIDENASKIAIINKVNADVFKYVSHSKSRLGVGGMKTKLVAAQIANKANIPMVLASYKNAKGEIQYIDNYLINEILEGKDIGTLFIPDTSDTLTSKKHWLAFGSQESGSIMVNNGAKKALIKNKTSLLPSGIIGITGNFEKNDIVTIVNEDDKIIGKGMVEYSSGDIQKIMGKHSSEIGGILDIMNYSSEVINRSYLVIMNEN